MGDLQITAAALLGLGEARYRTDDDAGALANWLSVTQLPETTSTYPAWRNVAAAQVRAGDLQEAFASYKEADRRAPPQDKAEIANRLGWLSKELGNQGAANRYFAKGRGDVFQITLTKLIIAVTVVISPTVYLTQDPPEGQQLLAALWLDKAAVAGGEYWRLWTVAFVHADWLHLLFNMWALWIVGPLVERWYGPIRFLVFIRLRGDRLGRQLRVRRGRPLGGCLGRDLRDVRRPRCGELDPPSGRSLRTGNRETDRGPHPDQPRVRVRVGSMIDNAAHIGGLLGGLWLGAVIPRAAWRPCRPTGGGRSGGHGPGARPPAVLPVLAVGALALPSWRASHTARPRETAEGVGD